jgi:hypothetical protein
MTEVYIYIYVPNYPPGAPNSFCQRINIESRHQIAKRYTVCRQNMPDPDRNHSKRRRTGSPSAYSIPDTGVGSDAFFVVPTTEVTGYESAGSAKLECTRLNAGTQTEPHDQAPSGLTSTEPSTLYLQGSFEEVSRTYIKSIYLGRTRDEQDHWIWHKMEMQHALDSLKRSRDSIDKLPDPKFVLPRQSSALPKMSLSNGAPEAVEDLVQSWLEVQAATTSLLNCTSRTPHRRQACRAVYDPDFLSEMRHQARFWMEVLSHEYDVNASSLALKCLLGLVLLSPATKGISAKPRNLPNNPVGHFGGPPAGEPNDPVI